MEYLRVENFPDELTEGAASMANIRVERRWFAVGGWSLKAVPRVETRGFRESKNGAAGFIPRG
jgi:hypothetical protein